MSTGIALIALILGPVVLGLAVAMLALPFIAVWWIVRAFIASTSIQQVPVYIARKLAKQGKPIDAARWYLHVLSLPNYEKLLEFNLFGLHKHEIANFLNTYRDKLPKSLRDDLSNFVWADTLLEGKISETKIWANDNASLINLGKRLVESAHKPMQPKVLKILRDCAKECENNAPELAVVLRQELTITKKYNLKPMDSPVRLNNEPAIELRAREGICRLCGVMEVCKGFDIYAILSYSFNAMSGQGRVIFSRYLGWLDVLFCDKCMSEPVRQASLQAYHRWTRRAKLASLATVLAALTLFLLILNDYFDASWALPMTISGGCVALIILAISLWNVFNPKSYERGVYYNYVYDFRENARQDLLAECDLTECEFSYNAYNAEPTPKYVGFMIEPPVINKIMTAKNGTQWTEEIH